MDNFTFIQLILPRGHKSVIGPTNYVKPIKVRNVIKRRGDEDIRFTPNSIRKHRNQAHVYHFNSLWGDLDFCNYNLAVKESLKVKSILDEKGVFYIIVCSGRGIHFYIPISLDDHCEWYRLNLYVNTVWFAEYGDVLDIGVAKDSARMMRLPQTINTKNGKHCTVLFSNIDNSIDYKAHNYWMVLNSYAENRGGMSDGAEPHGEYVFDFNLGRFESVLFKSMLELDTEITDLMFRAKKDRGLNDFLYPNLVAYCHQEEKAFGRARAFVELIGGSVENLGRWIKHDRKNRLAFNMKSLLNWAESYFPASLIAELAQADWYRFQYHAYFKYFQDKLALETIESVRRKIGEFVESRKTTPGVHVLVAECGGGKTEAFKRLAEEGRRIVLLIPYTMTRLNLEDDCHANLKIYTYDTVSPNLSKSKAFQERHLQLKRDLMHADIVVVDECHCLKTMEGISATKKALLEMVQRQIIDVSSRSKPVFLLTGTPAVSQISMAPQPILLSREKKRVRIIIIDDSHFMDVFAENDKILIFIDDKKDVNTLEQKLKTLGLEHEIFSITGESDFKSKLETNAAIQEAKKFVVVASSAFSSGLNCPLDTVVFSNKIMCQMNFYQVLGRLRMANKPDRVHPVFVFNLSPFRNFRATEDLFEFFSPSVCITYAKAVCTIVGIEYRYSRRMKSISRIHTFEDLYEAIKLTRNIGSFYRKYEHFVIPEFIVDRLGGDQDFNFEKWFNFPYRCIKDERYKIQGQYFIKKKMRLSDGSSRYAFVDLKELESFLGLQPDPISYFRRYLERGLRKYFEIENDVIRLKLD